MPPWNPAVWENFTCDIIAPEVPIRQNEDTVRLPTCNRSRRARRLRRLMIGG
jgi:hypothetical protein